MAIIESNIEALVVGIPMVGLLFVGVFRLDELFGRKPKRVVRRRPPVVELDERGVPIGTDPDGIPLKTVRKKGNAQV